MQTVEAQLVSEGTYKGVIVSFEAPIGSKLREGILNVPVKVYFTVDSVAHYVFVHIGLTLGAWALFRNHTKDIEGNVTIVRVKHRTIGQRVFLDTQFTGGTP